MERSSYPTLPAFLAQHLAVERPVALAERRRDGERRLSSREVHETAVAVAYALHGRGIETGDRVAIVAQNSVDWLLADFGILYAGAVVVPVFATIADDQARFIFEDSATKVIFAEDAATAARLRETVHPSVQIVIFEGTDDRSFAAFVAEGRALAAADPARLASFTASLDPEQLAVLIYTSGTTGVPKGVMLAHRNLTSNAIDAFTEGNLIAGEPVLCVLPFAHIFECIDAIGYIYVGAETWVTTPERLIDDLRAVRPRYMAVVPRILERVLASVLGGARAAGGVKAKLVPWALATGAAVERRRRAGGTVSPAMRLQLRLARALVLDKVKVALGLDNCRYLVSGSAPLHVDTAYAYAGMGIEICEGYGLTETSPVITVNRLEENRLGTVGKPIPNVDLRLADDGEIEVRGPNVMLGYYHTPAEDQPFTPDGWFKTGDIGTFTDGRLQITDRKNELFKTTGGKWIAPARIETAIKRSIYVGQALVVGYERPHPAALVAPNWDLVRRDLHIGADVPTAEIAERDDALALVLREVREHTADLATFEQIRRIALLPRDLTIEDGELSPTLKVKRRVVERRYAALIERAYASEAAPRTAVAAGSRR